MDRTKLARLLVVVPLLAAGIALGRPLPAAAVADCTTTITGGTIKESVVVPAGAACTLEGVTVRGGITVEPGGRLNVRDGSEIRGAISAAAPTDVTVWDAVVRGSVTVTGMLSDGVDRIDLLRADVRGDLVLTDNTGEFIRIADTAVRGDVVLSGNAMSTGIGVFRNQIDADLDCADNEPDPSTFGNGQNTVGGAATGECAGLVGP